MRAQKLYVRYILLSPTHFFSSSVSQLIAHRMTDLQELKGQALAEAIRELRPGQNVELIIAEARRPTKYVTRQVTVSHVSFHKNSVTVLTKGSQGQLIKLRLPEAGFVIYKLSPISAPPSGGSTTERDIGSHGRVSPKGSSSHEIPKSPRNKHREVPPVKDSPVSSPLELNTNSPYNASFDVPQKVPISDYTNSGGSSTARVSAAVLHRSLLSNVEVPKSRSLLGSSSSSSIPKQNVPPLNLPIQLPSTVPVREVTSPLHASVSFSPSDFASVGRDSVTTVSCAEALRPPISRPFDSVARTSVNPNHSLFTSTSVRPVLTSREDRTRTSRMGSPIPSPRPASVRRVMSPGITTSQSVTKTIEYYPLESVPRVTPFISSSVLSSRASTWSSRASTALSGSSTARLSTSSAYDDDLSAYPPGTRITYSSFTTPFAASMYTSTSSPMVRTPSSLGALFPLSQTSRAYTL